MAQDGGEMRIGTNGATTALPDGGRFHTLDAMRGLAAIAVVLHHLSWIVFVPMFRAGYLAVDFFFALSGFVLAAAYSQRLADGMGFLRFVEVRVVRLYPLFLIGLMFGIVKGVGQIALHDNLALSPVQFASAIGSGLLMLPSPLSTRWLFPLDAPAWSLFFELIINLIFARFLFAARSQVLVLACVIAGVLIVFGAFRLGNTAGGDQWPLFYYGLARVTFSFCIGMLIWRLRVGRALSRTMLALLPALVLILLLAPEVTPSLMPYYDSAAVILLLPAILWIGTGLELPNRLRLPGAFLGDISYPLYIIHYPLISIGWVVARHFLSSLAYVVVITPTLVAFAWGLGRFVDQPVRTWLNMRLRLRKSASMQTM